MMKRLLFLLMTLMALNISAQNSDSTRDDVVDTVYTVHSINQDQFKQLVADWSASDWKLVSPRPVVVDFYADWCMPCRRLDPILRQIAQHYEGTIDFYRINVDQNPEIAGAFGIRSIPCLFICPMDGERKNIIGLFSMEEYIRIINQTLGR